MFDIIPNWHPIFVHFTVALLSLSVILFVVTLFIKSPQLKSQWKIVAHWSLWFGAGFTVFTGLAGFDAYNTVAHDTPSHEAMTEHRNWAIATMLLFFALAIWSFIRIRGQQALGVVFVMLMLVGGGLLASTAWHGGELVYRYGLGVMSLPKSDGEGHAHKHADGSEHEHTETKKNTVNKDGLKEMKKRHDNDHLHSDKAVIEKSAESHSHDAHDNNHEH